MGSIRVYKGSIIRFYNDNIGSLIIRSGFL